MEYINLLRIVVDSVILMIQKHTLKKKRQKNIDMEMHIILIQKNV